MLEEAAHELLAAQAGGPPLHRFAIFVTDGDALVVESDDAAVGDGDAEHVAGEIAKHSLTAFAPGRTVHDPRLPPCSLRQDQVRTALCERGPELAAHQLGQGPDRNQEAVARGMPIAAIVGDAATGDQTMDMGMEEPSLKIPGIIISLIFSEQRKLVSRATPLPN